MPDENHEVQYVSNAETGQAWAAFILGELYGAHGSYGRGNRVGFDPTQAKERSWSGIWMICETKPN